MHGRVDPKMGSTSVVVNASGGVVGTSGYYPYGETRYGTGTLYIDKLFTSIGDKLPLRGQACQPRSLVAPGCPTAA
jgi:hypothetical protein